MPKSDILLNRSDSILLVIDFQERLAHAMANQEEVEKRIVQLVSIAGILSIPVMITEQYTRGLGPTTERIRIAAESESRFNPIEKMSFSCFGSDQFVSSFESIKPGNQVIITGIETHVCVLQTVLHACQRGLTPFVVVDGVTSRHEKDYHTALVRMERSGAHLVTTEMVAFECLEKAGTPEFKKVQKVIL